MENKEVNTTIRLVENGPMVVKGAFEIIGADGQLIPLTTQQAEKGVYLCRCGKSKNKPFCDGSHAK